ncbi:MAG: DUF2125 domain-containing protein [Alkalilacustris sp.]
MVRPRLSSRPSFSSGLTGRAGALAILSATVALPALAEITPDGVWQDWQQQAARAGQSLSAETTETTDTGLVVRGVTLGSPGALPEVSVRIEEISFADQDGGAVLVRMSDSYDVSIRGADDALVRLAVAHPGLRLEVSRSDDGMLHHDVSAPEISVSLQELRGAELPDEAVIELSALRVAGRYGVAGDALARTVASLTAGAVDFELAFRDGANAVDVDYAATGLTVRFDGAGLDQGGVAGIFNLSDALSAGLAVDFAQEHETQRFSILSVENGETAAASGRSMEGRTLFRLDATELAVGSESRNSELTLPGEALAPALADGLGAPPADMADEITLRAAETALSLRLPTGGAPQPQDMHALVRLVDVTAPEAVWAMADPSGGLQRAPLTMILDLAGGLVLPDDLFGMGTMFAFMMGGPYEAVQPTSLDVRELALRFAGAELTGEGSFALDPTDLETFPGFPRPEGRLDLTLRNGEALITTLVEAGLLPADQANAARLMIALLGRPGEAPGELVSTIEVDAGGAVRTNGMRMR